MVLASWLFSTGLLGHPYDRAAAFPNSNWSKRSRRKQQHLLWPSLKSHILSLPQYAAPRAKQSLFAVGRDYTGSDYKEAKTPGGHLRGWLLPWHTGTLRFFYFLSFGSIWGSYFIFQPFYWKFCFSYFHFFNNFLILWLFFMIYYFCSIDYLSFPHYRSWWWDFVLFQDFLCFLHYLYFLHFLFGLHLSPPVEDFFRYLGILDLPNHVGE